MDTINQQTLERYLAASNLTPDQKKALRKEFKKGDKKEVYAKAVRLNGRKPMTKTPVINTK